MPEDVTRNGNQADEQRLWETFDRYREYIKHQYDLTNHRTTWFVTMNAFLFTTFGFTIQKKLEVMNRFPSDFTCPGAYGPLCATISNIDVFMLILCLVGLASSFIAFFLLESARRPIRDIADKWETLIGTQDVAGRRVAAKLQTTHWLLLVGGVNRRTAHFGRILTSAFPVVLSGVWPTLAIFSGIAKSDVGAHRDWPSWIDVSSYGPHLWLVPFIPFMIIALTISLSIYFEKRW